MVAVIVPRGRLGRGRLASTNASFTASTATAVTGCTATVNATTRPLRVEAHGTFQHSVASGRVQAAITEDGTIVKSGIFFITPNAGGTSEINLSVARDANSATPLVAGAHTYVLTLFLLDAGTATLVANASYAFELTVDEV